jgi:hypothetical protein
MSYKVEEYELNGHTYLFTAEDAERYGAKPVKRAVKRPKGTTPGKPPSKAGKADKAKAKADAEAKAKADAEAGTEGDDEE